MGLLLAATNSGWAQAVVETTTTTTNAAGTISEFGPEILVIRTETAPEPIRYSYNTKTVYVDEAGAPVTLTKTGGPSNYLEGRLTAFPSRTTGKTCGLHGVGRWQRWHHCISRVAVVCAL
jgi:hypothetical protein